MPNHRRPAPLRPQATMKRAHSKRSPVTSSSSGRYRTIARAFCDTLAEQMREVFPITRKVCLESLPD